MDLKQEGKVRGTIGVRDMTRSVTPVDAHATIGLNSVVVLEHKAASSVFDIV